MTNLKYPSVAMPCRLRPYQPFTLNFVAAKPGQ